MADMFTDLDQKTLLNIIKARRDVRGHAFTDRQIDDSTLHKILEAALWGPSVGFSQPWRFVVVRDMKKKKEIKESFLEANEKAAEKFTGKKQELYNSLKLDGILEAPVGIAAFYEQSKGAVLGQNSMKETGAYSVVCAIQNLWLMARACGVGVGWVSILDPKAVGRILGAKEHQKLIGYLCLGYVEEFLDGPELEKKGWAVRKMWQNCIFEESLTL